MCYPEPEPVLELEQEPGQSWTSSTTLQMSDCEWFAQIALDKWVIVSESLRSLMSKEQLWVNRSGCSWQKSNHEQIRSGRSW